MTTGHSSMDSLFSALAAQGLTPTGRLTRSDPEIQEFPAPSEELHKLQRGLRKALEISHNAQQRAARARAGCPSLPGDPILTWRTGGTPHFRGWVMVDVVTDIASLAVGDILLEDSIQFDALNLCKVSKAAPADEPYKRVHAIFVDPVDTDQLREGANRDGFVIWDYDFKEPRGSSRRFYRVQRKTM